MPSETTITQTPQLKEFYGGGRRTMAKKAFTGPGAVDVSAKVKVKTAPGKPRSALAGRLRTLARNRIGVKRGKY
jgi:hypothetical protein